MTIRVGDRVRIVQDKVTGTWVGRIGTVVEIDSDDPAQFLPYRVRFDDESDPNWFDRDELAYTSLAGDTSAVGHA